MVRIKHRYLLVNILYPELPTSGHDFDKAHSTSTVPDSKQFHWPTPDSLTPQLLAKAIRNQILYMYGDYGYGITSTGLNGRSTLTIHTRIFPVSREHSWASKELLTLKPSGSQISVFSNIHNNHSLLQSELPARMGSIDLHDASTRTSEAIYLTVVCNAGCKSLRDHQEGRRRGHQACSSSNSECTEGKW